MTMTDPETRPRAGAGGGGFGDTEIHERFSHPDRECHDEGFAQQVLHECDLPKDHETRHQCGVCGLKFGEDAG